MLLTQPGIYKDVLNEIYHQSKGISSSGIKLLLPPSCPRKYWYQYLSGQYIREEKSTFMLGSALHTLALEPDTFFERYYVEPIKIIRNKKHKAYQELLAKAGLKTILFEDEYLEVKAMADNIRGHAIFKKIGSQGHIEDSILWFDIETGAHLRTRPDFYNDFVIIDIKTTKNISKRSFSSSIADYGYHIQAAMQCDGLYEMTNIEYKHVIYFCVENEKPPYLVKAYCIDDAGLELGRKKYKEGAKIYRECLDSNAWPAYDETIEDISLPKWTNYEEQSA